MHKDSAPGFGCAVCVIGFYDDCQGLLFDDDDAALAGEILILLADHALQRLGDVVDQHLVVQLDTVLQQRRAVKHRVAVAIVEQHVVVAGQRVGGLRVDGLAVDKDVLHAPLALDAGEHAVLVALAGRFDIAVDLIAQTRDLQEAAVLAGYRAGAPLERVKDLLARDLDDAHGVAEGMDLEDVVERDLARVDAHADAAAVDKGDIGAGLDTVSVGAEVAEVGLSAADHADGLAVGVDLFGIVDGEKHLGARHDFLQLLLQGAGGLVDKRGGLVRDAQQRGSALVVVPGVEACGDLALGVDAAPADAGQFCAAGGADDFLAVLVLHDDLVGIMAVAVQEHVDAGDVGDNVGVGPHSSSLPMWPRTTT